MNISEDLVAFVNRIPDEHLRYEWMMVLNIINWRFVGGDPHARLIENNALHESFWIHAVNLATYYEFYDATDTIFEKVHDQVTTLTFRRTSVVGDKLQPADRMTFMKRLLMFSGAPADGL